MSSLANSPESVNGSASVDENYTQVPEWILLARRIPGESKPRRPLTASAVLVYSVAVRLAKDKIGIWATPGLASTIADRLGLSAQAVRRIIKNQLVPLGYLSPETLESGERAYLFLARPEIPDLSDLERAEGLLDTVEHRWVDRSLRIPDRIAGEKRLCASVKILGAFYRSLASGSRGRADMARFRVAARLGMGPESVSRYLATLEVAGIVKATQRVHKSTVVAMIGYGVQGTSLARLKLRPNAQKRTKRHMDELNATPDELNATPDELNAIRDRFKAGVESGVESGVAGRAGYVFSRGNPAPRILERQEARRTKRHTEAQAYTRKAG